MFAWTTAIITALAVLITSAVDAQELKGDSVLSEIERLSIELSRLETKLDQVESDLSGVHEVLDGLPRNVAMTASTFQKNFDGVTNWTAIPNSSNAIYCALSRVDDDAPHGSCLVRRRNSRWEYIAGGDSGANHCEVMCLRLSVTLD